MMDFYYLLKIPTSLKTSKANVLFLPRSQGDKIEPGTTIAVVESNNKRFEIIAKAAGSFINYLISPGREIGPGEDFAKLAIQAEEAPYHRPTCELQDY